jgi:hypothetical protein
LNGDGGEVTDLTGILPDQTALQGVLKRIWDLNLTVLSANISRPKTGGDEEAPAGPGE